MSRSIGRQSSEETQELSLGLDFRLPQYRREVFLRFYEFHLENRSHPGAIYYAMPWLAERHALGREQMLWLAFINGNTQNIVTTWLIMARFPEIRGLDVEALGSWFNENYDKLGWDTDRRYHKKDFIASVRCYMELTQGDQGAYFGQFMVPGDEEESFRRAWAQIRGKFYTFGRLSTFSYCEYLRIVGLPILCDQLFLEDMEGSKSHRNGLARVLGRDDLDWHKDLTFTGDYSPQELDWLKQEGESLLEEARIRTSSNTSIDPREVSYFTLESALCTYKSWHRKNRRYANVYNDMFYDRIAKAECHWGAEVQDFWRCREECTPPHLLLERCLSDPGLCPEKQNHYRLTGQVIMMSRRWPEFDNPFDRKVWQDVA